MTTQVINPFNNPSIKSLEDIATAKSWRDFFIVCGIIAAIGLMCWFFTKKTDDIDRAKR